MGLHMEEPFARGDILVPRGSRLRETLGSQLVLPSGKPSHSAHGPPGHVAVYRHTLRIHAYNASRRVYRSVDRHAVATLTIAQQTQFHGAFVEQRLEGTPLLAQLETEVVSVQLASKVGLLHVDTGDQLASVKRLAQDVVGLNNVAGSLVGRRQEDDRHHLLFPRATAQHAQQFWSTQTSKHHVCDDEVWGVGLKLVQSLLAIACFHDLAERLENRTHIPSSVGQV